MFVYVWPQLILHQEEEEIIEEMKSVPRKRRPIIFYGLNYVVYEVEVCRTESLVE